MTFSGLVLAAARFHRSAVLSVSLLCCGLAPAKAPCPLPLVGAVALAVATLRQSLRSPVAGPQFPRSLNPRSLRSRPAGFGESGIGLRPLFCFIFTDVRYALCRDKPKQNPPASLKCRLRQWRQTRLVLPTASRRRGRTLSDGTPQWPRLRFLCHLRRRYCGDAGARPRGLQSGRYAPRCASFRRHDRLRFTLD